MIDARDNVGRTPLHWAAGNAYIGAVRLLLEHGVDVNVRDEGGKHPFPIGVISGASRDCKTAVCIWCQVYRRVVSAVDCMMYLQY